MQYRLKTNKKFLKLIKRLSLPTIPLPHFMLRINLSPYETHAQNGSASQKSTISHKSIKPNRAAIQYRTENPRDTSQPCNTHKCHPQPRCCRLLSGNGNGNRTNRRIREECVTSTTHLCACSLQRCAALMISHASRRLTTSMRRRRRNEQHRHVANVLPARNGCLNARH